MRTPPPNPLATYGDLQSAFRSLEEPLLLAWDRTRAGPDLGGHRGAFGADILTLETVARYLWGLTFYSAGGGESRGWPLVREALVCGIDPAHPAYWGEVRPFDQRAVEMASIGVALRLVPHLIWEPLDAKHKDALARWLGGVVDKELVPNNWQFFRLLTTMGLRHVGRTPPGADEHERRSVEMLDSYYLGDGWYADGHTEQLDYYIPTGFHFYSLLCAHLTTEGPVVDRATEWRERAEQFQHDFVHWFAADGAALPFGRSLTYRFAQGAFWGASGVAGLGGMAPGLRRGLLLQHLRWWWQQPFLNTDGTMSLGYAYPNHNMLELYNAAGSPYWAFKTFMPLMLPESHPFWTDREMSLKELPPPPSTSVQRHARMVIQRDSGSGHVVALNAGQWHTWPLRHRDAKYAKFAYSTYFGPCVGPNHEWLRGTGLDSTLSVVPGNEPPEDGALWLNRGRTTGHFLSDRFVASDWTDAPGIAVRTWLIPLAGWHVRVHRVDTDNSIQLAEGGFAVPDPRIIERSPSALAISDDAGGVSGISDPLGHRAAAACEVEANSSLYHSSVRLPMLTTTLSPGRHWLLTLILGAAPGSNATWSNAPGVSMTPDCMLRVTHEAAVLEMDLKSPRPCSAIATSQRANT